MFFPGYVAHARSVVAWMDGEWSFTSSSGEKQMFDLEKLIQFFILTGYHRSAGSLLLTLHKTFDVLLPSGAAAHFKSLLGKGGNRVPSPATISRARFSVDAAFMLWHQCFFANIFADGGLTAVMLADASPIAMREWLVAEIFLSGTTSYGTSTKLQLI